MTKNYLCVFLSFITVACSAGLEEESNSRIPTRQIPDESGVVCYVSSCDNNMDGQGKYPTFRDTLFFDSKYKVHLFDTVQLIYSDSISDILPLCLFSEYKYSNELTKGYYLDYFYLLLTKDSDSLIYFIRMCENQNDEEYDH